MNLKEKVLKILEEKKGESVSGEALAEQLGVSRTAIWKAVSVLKKEGYDIGAGTNKGYSLSMNSGKLSEVALRPHLEKPKSSLNADREIVVLETIDSTNNEAKRIISSATSIDSIPYGTIIIANEQTAGKGRRGRSFFSPTSSSIYVSFILKPVDTIENSLLITIAAAVAVCRTVETVCDSEQKPEIKWVNDIFVKGKKICGILTEAVSDIESGQIESLVLGIGVNININPEDFPEEIRDIAGSVTIPPGERNRFVAVLANEVFNIYESLSVGENIIEEYRERSLMEGREIEVIKSNGKEKAIAKKIMDNGSLLVIYSDGREETLRSGEVSISL